MPPLPPQPGGPGDAPASSEPRLLDLVRRSLAQHQVPPPLHAVYVRVVVRYVHFHRLQHRRDLTAPAVQTFLDHLSATEAETDPHRLHARDALAFLYRTVLGLALDLAPPASDVDLGRKQIAIRAAKGNKDRVVMPPRRLESALARQLERAAALHQRDLRRGLGRVELPTALDRKYPSAAGKLAWQFVFPSRLLRVCSERGGTTALTAMRKCLQCVFYDVEEKPENVVTILAVGIKDRNRVLLGGEEVSMKVVEKEKATATLAAYADDIGNGPVVITDQGMPVAVLVPIQNADLETVSLSTNRQFLELIERSRERVRAEGGISSEEMRRRFA